MFTDIWKRFPRTDSPEDIALAKDEDEENWKFYTDRLLGQGYSKYILDKFYHEGTLPIMYDEDFRLTNLPIDFYGMNYYNTLTVGVRKQAETSGENGGNFYIQHQSHPENLGKILKFIKASYKLNIPVYVTENGFSGKNETPASDGMIHDDERIAYIDKALKSVDELLGEGIDVRGYYLWSLMDNFEWSAGYESKYGLIHTNFETMERTWKKSAYWYRDFILKVMNEG